MEFDNELVPVLFKEELYNEVYSLIWNVKEIQLNFTKEHFREVIKNGEQLDLIIYFLKLPDCRIILDESVVQKDIVDIYMMYYFLIKCR